MVSEVSNAEVSREPANAWRNGRKLSQWAINVFLLFHIFAIVTWSVPLDTPLVNTFRQWIRPYMLWTGLFQSWDTFAPTPRTVNAYIQGVVITKDGQIHTWKFPRMEQLSLTERYYKERYRKFQENLPSQANSALWPDAARHLARMYANPANPPEIVMLVHYWSDIPPPSTGPYKAAPERAKIFFEYRVQPGDLK
jgi:hypothetical protein